MIPVRVQWKPNLVRYEKRICLTRIRWERGAVGVAGGGYSAKLSVSLCWVPQDLWVGAFWRKGDGGWSLWLCVLPCLPLRVKLVKSYGGIFP